MNFQAVIILCIWSTISTQLINEQFIFAPNIGPNNKVINPLHIQTAMTSQGIIANLKINPLELMLQPKSGFQRSLTQKQHKRLFLGSKSKL